MIKIIIQVVLCSLIFSISNITAASENTEKQVEKMINIAFDVISRKHSASQLKMLNEEFVAQKSKLSSRSIYKNIKNLRVTTIADAQTALDKLSDIEMSFHH